MEFLYITGIAAVSVLCLALLSTARRILRSSPRPGAQFGSTRMYGVDQAERELLDDIGSTSITAPAGEVLPMESVLALSEPFELENVAGHAVSAKPIVAAPVEPVTAASPAPATSDWPEESIDEAPTWASRWARFPKPSRQTYNYALECLLIGVSAWVLIKTQRETLRQQPAQTSSSRDRVA